MHKFNRIRRAHLMSNYFDHALVIFGHAHLDSRTDSRALRAEYRI